MIQDVDNVNNNVGFWSYGHDFRIVEHLTPSFAPFSDAELQAIDNAATKRFVDYQARLGVFAMQQTPGAGLGMVYIEEPDGLEHQYLLTDQRQAVNPTDPNSIGTAFGGTTDFAADPTVAQYAANIQAAYQYANDAVQKILDLVGTDANGVPKSDIIVVSDHGFDPFYASATIQTIVSGVVLPAVNTALTNAGLATITSNDIRAVTSGPAVNIYLNLDMRPNGVAGTVSKAICRGGAGDRQRPQGHSGHRHRLQPDRSGEPVRHRPRPSARPGGQRSEPGSVDRRPGRPG